ncbi:uncharacterized protein LOC135485397 [Lineus longissimus]|uniref:uncharacterized protein LOC135485397 n=1 Tax=Lineus longissimus TaxID=88925 RepID=UPI00315C5D84
MVYIEYSKVYQCFQGFTNSILYQLPLAHSVNTSAGAETPHLHQNQRPLDGFIMADSTSLRSRTRLASKAEKSAESVKVKPRKLGLDKSAQSPLSLGHFGGAVKRKRKGCSIILDDSDDDDVVEIKEPSSLKNVDSPSSTVIRTKPEVMSPEYRQRVVDWRKSEIYKKKTPSPLTTSTSNGSSDGISPRPSARFNQPVNTPLRTLLLDDLLSSQAESQVDVKWDCRSPNAIRDAKMYQMGSDQDGSDLIAMLKQVEKQASPEHFGTPPPAPIFSMLCLPNDRETNLARITETREITTRMARRNSRKKDVPKNAQSLEFMQKLAEYIQDQADVEKDHDEDYKNVDLKEEEGRSPKLVPEFDLNEAVHEELDSLDAEDDLFGNDEAASSKIATQLEPSLLFGGVTPSAKCGDLRPYTEVDREIMHDMSLLKDIKSGELGKDIVEKGAVKTKTDLVDEFCGDDTLDDLFGDESFMEKATQMELFDDKTKSFKTPKVLGKVVTSCLSSKDCEEQSVSVSGAPQLRQKLFTKPGVSKSATLVPQIKTSLATAVCSTCVANRLPISSSSCVSFPNNSSKSKETYVGETTILSKPSGQYGEQSKQPSFHNNKGAKPAAASCVTSSNSNWAKKPPGVVSRAQTLTDVKKPTGYTFPIRAQTMPNATVSGAVSQNMTNFGAKLPPSRSSTIPAPMTNSSQAIGQSFAKSNKPAAIVSKTPAATLSSNSIDAAYFDDLSLSEDLLIQLAEPDDVLDSQVCNSGSSSSSVEQIQADALKVAQSKNKTKTAKSVDSQRSTPSFGNKPNVRGSVNTSSSNSVMRPVSSQRETMACKAVVSNTMSAATRSMRSSAPSQPSTRKCFQIGNEFETNTREASTLILEDSDLGIPPTPQVQSKFIKAQKFNFKSTNLSTGVNAVTRSQAKISHPACMVGPEKLQEKPVSNDKASQDKNAVVFGLGNDDDDDDDLFEPEVLAMLENVENQASQSSSQPWSQNQCSAEQIEKKKQEALKRRIEKKRQEAIKRRGAQLQASQKAQAARSCNVGGLSQTRRTRKS